MGKVGLTDEEKEVVDLLADAWNKFVKLPNKHPSDNPDFAQGIHRCQYLVAKRVAVRADPDFWDLYD